MTRARKLRLQSFGTWDVRLSRDKGRSVAQCLNFDVASEGATDAEALANVGAAIKLAFGFTRTKTGPQ